MNMQELVRTMCDEKADPIARLKNWKVVEVEINPLGQRIADEARNLGYTWQEIGEAIGISKQGAHGRFTEKA